MGSHHQNLYSILFVHFLLCEVGARLYYLGKKKFASTYLLLNSLFTGSEVYSSFCTSSWFFRIFCSFLLPSRLLRYLYFRLRVCKDCGWTCSTWTIVVDLLPESVAAVHRQTALANLHKKYTLQSVVCLIYSSLSLSFDVGLCENHFQLVLAISFSFFRFRSLIFCQQLSFKRR